MWLRSVVVHEVTMTTLADLRALPHTSISQVRTFLLCPRKYCLHDVAKSPPAWRPRALIFGSAWHESIGAHLLEPMSVEALQADLRDRLVRGIRSDGPPVLFEEDAHDEGQVIDLSLRMLAVFLARIPRPAKVLAVELPFALELAHPATGEVLDVPLIGAIDALIDEAGTKVWELKTAKKKWSQDQLDFDLQMTGYGMAARSLGCGDAALEILVTTKTKIPDVQVTSLVRHRRDENELLATVFGVLHAVAAGVDYPLRGWQCRTCAHAAACGS